MTAMIQRVKTILTTPLFVSAAHVDDAQGVWVSAWTENRPLPPAMPTWEDEDIEDLFDGLFSTAA